jgi:lipid II:glycine glycyltransferase (peptidoglycan interpeptide bridge formation enzyme)
MTIRRAEDTQEWDDFVNDLSGHPLQLWGWGDLKGAHNWHPSRLLWEQDGIVKGGAQVLVRPLPWPFGRLTYIPRGPFGELADSQEGMREVAEYVRQNIGGVLLTVEPDQEKVGWGSKWHQSSNTILIPRTLVLDLSQSEEDLLAAMTKKTRQYIRKSERDGVAIRQLRTREEIADALAIYHDTATRAHFAIHDDQYYYDCAELMGDSSLIFGAYHEGQLVSFVWLVISSEVAFELYGGMSQQGQDLRANYALKWHAIRKCKEWGIARYDMNGLLNDGVSTFKEGFSDHETMLAGTYDYPLSPLYAIWAKFLPLGKKIIRSVKSLRK